MNAIRLLLIILGFGCAIAFASLHYTERTAEGKGLGELRLLSWSSLFGIAALGCFFAGARVPLTGSAIEKNKAQDIIAKRIENLDRECLSLFYEQYVARFLSDNNRIWVTGSIMIPLSLSAFALLPTIKDPTRFQLLPLAIVSCAILVIWNLIADVHRQFQDKSMLWMLAIESKLAPESAPTPVIHKVGRPGYSVRFWRWALAAIVLVSWLYVLVAWPTK